MQRFLSALFFHRDINRHDRKITWPISFICTFPFNFFYIYSYLLISIYLHIIIFVLVLKTAKDEVICFIFTPRGLVFQTVLYGTHCSHWVQTLYQKWCKGSNLYVKFMMVEWVLVYWCGLFFLYINTFFFCICFYEIWIFLFSHLKSIFLSFSLFL